MMLTNLLFTPRAVSLPFPRPYESQIQAQTDHMDQDSLDDTKTQPQNTNDVDENISKRYKLDTYDQEKDIPLLGSNFKNLTVFESNVEDPYLIRDDQGDLEELEDLLIRPTDYVLLSAVTEGENYSHLDVCILPEDGDQPYVHHDYFLSDFPLALAWLAPNRCVVGTFKPTIEIWDLNILNSPSPMVILSGHSDSVLGIASHPSISQMIASASADHTVALWDVERAIAVQKLDHHTDKVQSVAWMLGDENVLASGAFDRTVFLVDVRAPTTQYQKIELSGDVECIKWWNDQMAPSSSSHNTDTAISRSNYLYISTDNGDLQCYDVVAGKNRWVLSAYLNRPCASFALQSHSDGSGLIVTACPETQSPLKVWALDQTLSSPRCIYNKTSALGKLHAVEMTETLPFKVAVGCHLPVPTMINILDWQSVYNQFGHLPESKPTSEDSKVTLEELMNRNIDGDDDDDSDDNQQYMMQERSSNPPQRTRSMGSSSIKSTSQAIVGKTHNNPTQEIRERLIMKTTRSKMITNRKG